MAPFLYRARAAATLIAAGLACGAALPLAAQWPTHLPPNIPRNSKGEINLDAPAPTTRDGKPDLSGVWSTTAYFFDLAKDLKPEDVVMQPWAKELQQLRESRDHKDDPMGFCMPPGVPRIDTSNAGDALHPFKIVQTDSLVVLLYETSSNSNFRQVFIDGRSLPTDVEPTWLGYSVGHWERNTLVVDTTGFNGRAWLDTGKGHPQTDAAHVTERFTRRDFGHMDLEITIDDPKAYEKPWHMQMPVVLLPETDLIETVCENEKDSSRFVR